MLNFSRIFPDKRSKSKAWLLKIRKMFYANRWTTADNTANESLHRKSQKTDTMTISTPMSDRKSLAEMCIHYSSAETTFIQFNELHCSMSTVVICAMKSALSILFLVDKYWCHWPKFISLFLNIENAQFICLFEWDQMAFHQLHTFF